MKIAAINSYTYSFHFDPEPRCIWLGVEILESRSEPHKFYSLVREKGNNHT